MSTELVNVIGDDESRKLYVTTPKNKITGTPFNSTVQDIINRIGNGEETDATVINPYIDEFTKSNDIQKWNLGYILWSMTQNLNMKNKYERLPNSFFQVRDKKTGDYYHISSLVQPKPEDVEWGWSPKRARSVAKAYNFPEHRIYKDFYSNSPIAQTFSKANVCRANH